MKLKPFGTGGLSHNHGYTLSLLVGHLESLVDAESETLPESTKGRRWKRMDLVEDALQKLNDALAMGREDEE